MFDGPKDGLMDGPKDGLMDEPMGVPKDAPTNKFSCRDARTHLKISNNTYRCFFDIPANPLFTYSTNRPTHLSLNLIVMENSNLEVYN